MSYEEVPHIVGKLKKLSFQHLQFSSLSNFVTFKFQELKPTPTAQLDRRNDGVYHSTTCVVRAVMALSQSVQQQQVALYLDNVKSVGFELRKLLEAVDQLVPALPSSTHREVSKQTMTSSRPKMTEI